MDTLEEETDLLIFGVMTLQPIHGHKKVMFLFPFSWELVFLY